MSADSTPPVEFNGTVRLFPLPNLVLFPHVVQPLHIFEPRYRRMIADALEADRLIALVLLRPGWEADYQDKPVIHPVACLGRILAEQRLDDGRFNLLLRGAQRIRIVREVDSPTLYRVAEAEVLTDVPAPPGVAQRLRQQLAEMVDVWFPGQTPVIEQFRKLFQSNLDLGTLGDIFSFALPLEAEFKQALLAELDVERRLRRVLHQLETRQPAETADRKFPPAFSEN